MENTIREKRERISWNRKAGHTNIREGGEKEDSKLESRKCLLLLPVTHYNAHVSNSRPVVEMSLSRRTISNYHHSWPAALLH